VLKDGRVRGVEVVEAVLVQPLAQVSPHRL